MTDLMYTPAEYAAIMKVTVKTVLKWARAGDVPSVKVRGSVRFPASAIPVAVEREEASA